MVSFFEFLLITFGINMNNRMIRILFLLAFLVVTGNSFAQRNVRDSIIGTPWVALHYGLNSPGGDLATKFGILNHLGSMAGYKTTKNWVFGFDGNFIFGNRIKIPSLLANLADDQGNITDANGDIALIVVTARGFNVNVMVGKVIPIWSPNQNSGIYVHAGIGYVQHKVRVETQDQVIPTLELEYRKGYDRYTTGVNLHQFVGYAFLANQGIFNFYGGFYAQEGFTYNRRDVFFDLPGEPVSKKQMFELQLGFKVGWFIPVYQRKPKDFYYD